MPPGARGAWPRRSGRWPRLGSAALARQPRSPPCRTSCKRHSEAPARPTPTRSGRSGCGLPRWGGSERAGPPASLVRLRRRCPAQAGWGWRVSEVQRKCERVVASSLRVSAAQVALAPGALVVATLSNRWGPVEVARPRPPQVAATPAWSLRRAVDSLAKPSRGWSECSGLLCHRPTRAQGMTPARAPPLSSRGGKPPTHSQPPPGDHARTPHGIRICIRRI